MWRNVYRFMKDCCNESLCDLRVNHFLRAVYYKGEVVFYTTMVLV